MPLRDWKKGAARGRRWGAFRMEKDLERCQCRNKNDRERGGERPNAVTVSGLAWPRRPHVLSARCPPCEWAPGGAPGVTPGRGPSGGAPAFTA